MEWITVIVLLLIGLILIIKGGDYFVDSASWIAEVSGIPKLIVGATVVSFATTLPELLVSVFSAAKYNPVTNPGAVDLCVGNAVGSVTANTGLILAISLLCMPSIIKRKDYLLKAILLIGAVSVMTLFCWNGSLNIVGSILLIVIFAIAMFENVREAVKTMKQQKDSAEEKEPLTRKVVIVNILKFVFGVAGIVFGADLLVDNGSLFASMLGVPDRIIAITILAVGTSLPELVTTITAIVKKEHSLSAGNIIGANIIDLTLILPICGLVSGGALPVSLSAARIDIPVCLAVSCVAMLPTLIFKKFSRVQGAVLLILYIAYIAVSCMGLFSL
ncbi:MAG: calcium/sodium antiporter [Lachnospiraceae bacterium]|nr:calcium/sodium antiporter [Lachnospiraceae bacterium]